MQRSIHHKILIYFSAAALLTMLVLGVVVAWQLNRSFSQQAEELTRNLTTRIANSLDYPHQTFAVRLRSDIRRAADDVRQTPGLIADFKDKRALALQDTLQRASVREHLDFAALFDPDGRLQASFPSELDEQHVAEMFRRSEFGSLPQRVRQGQTENAEIWESLARLDPSTLKTLRIQATTPEPDGMVWMAAVSLLKDAVDEPIGFCLVGRLLTRYEDTLSELYDTGGYASVLYSGHTPVAQAGFGSLGTEAFDLTTLGLPPATAAAIMQTPTKTLHTLLLAGQAYLMTCAPLHAPNDPSIGSLCIGLPETRVSEIRQTFIAQNDRTRRQILTSMTQIGFLSIAIFMLLSLAITAAIVKPIRRLSQTSKHIAAGDLKHQIPLTSDDEIGELIMAFNQMTTNLRNTDRTVKQQTTELSAANQRLEDANQRLEEASRHKSDFLANMSHELRTPLNAIIGFTSMTLNALKDSLPEEHAQNLRKAETAARMLMQVISDVLDLSKIEAGELQIHLEEIYPEDLLDEIAITAEGLLLHKTIAFTCAYPDGMPPIRNDYVKMKQILNNLVSNAVKFTTAGSVTITATVLAEPSPEGSVRIAVQDTGCGIPADKLALIFESFKQVDGSIRKKFGGTGLGLAITKRFCETLGLDIRVESEVARGTTFWLTIPVSYRGLPEPAASQPISAAAPESQAMLPHIENTAVMLCLAAPDVCAALRRHLARIPLEVCQVSTLEECLEYAGSAMLWTVLIDTNEQGFAQIARLREHPVFAPMPVILCDQNGNRHDRQSSTLIEYLAKPIAEPQLFATLLRMVIQQTGSLLIVDDHQMNLDVEAAVFRQAGFTVATAQSGEDGIRQAVSRPPDIILMDLGMPGMDGFEATRHIKQHAATAGAIIIACSAFATAEYQERARAVGCEGYITKPVEPHRLIEQVTAYALAAKIRQRLQSSADA